MEVNPMEGTVGVELDGGQNCKELEEGAKPVEGWAIRSNVNGCTAVGTKDRKVDLETGNYVAGSEEPNVFTVRLSTILQVAANLVRGAGSVVTPS
jgi:hypothetical protein